MATPWRRPCWARGATLCAPRPGRYALRARAWLAAPGPPWKWLPPGHLHGTSSTSPSCVCVGGGGGCSLVGESGLSVSLRTAAAFCPRGTHSPVCSVSCHVDHCGMPPGGGLDHRNGVGVPMWGRGGTGVEKDRRQRQGRDGGGRPGLGSGHCLVTPGRGGGVFGALASPGGPTHPPTHNRKLTFL